MMLRSAVTIICNIALVLYRLFKIMGRTPLLRLLRKAVQRASLLEGRPELKLPLEFLESSDLPHKDRRKFLKRIASAGMAIGPAYAWGSVQKGIQQAERLMDWVLPPLHGSAVTILGGGISGLVTAYRLDQQGIPCEIYEASPRLGGRIWTHDKFNSEGMFCELGGELVDTGHAELLQIARELGLEIDDLSAADQGIDSQHYYFGGKHYTEKELLSRFEPFAKHILTDAKGIYADPVQQKINYKQHTPRSVLFDRMSMSQYLDSKRDVDQWVIDLIKVAYCGEYGTEPGEQSAINLFTLMGTDMATTGVHLFGHSDESKRIKGGNSRLIDALYQAIRPRVAIHMGHQLVGIRDSGNSFQLTFLENGRPVLRRVDQIVCTIPFPILREIKGIRKLGLSPVKMKAIRELGFGDNTKYMLGFREKNWRKSHPSHVPTGGYTFTDLPTQAFWETSRSQSGSLGVLTNFIGGRASATEWPDRQQKVLADLEKIYPGVASQFDGNQVIFRWGTYPFSRGSYTSCRPGQWTTLCGSPQETELGGRLLFAGEHVSEDFQGYMNGAVQSAFDAALKIVAMRHLKRGIARHSKSTTIAALR